MPFLYRPVSGITLQMVGLVATLVSGLVPTNALATTATGNAYRVAFTLWALTSQGSLVRSLSRLLREAYPRSGLRSRTGPLDRRSLKKA